MKNKKGIEPVIATVLIIVITLVLMAIVINFLLPLVSLPEDKDKNECGRQINCELYPIYKCTRNICIPINVTEICYDEITNKICER